jgi:anaerobic ribonucleoside-triphosphate reductase activating protein
MINVAETCVGTRALGPGLRSAAWVQGCPFDCRGCIAPEWIPQRRAREMTAEELAGELLADADVTGLTFSGGEPMLQAAGLAEVARIARGERDVTLICFTGFRFEELLDIPGAASLLSEADVLIDGRYVQARDDDRGLRGSANQRVHHLTGRLAGAGYDFIGGLRRAEVRIHGTEALMVGVPSRTLKAVWRTVGKETP